MDAEADESLANSTPILDGGDDDDEISDKELEAALEAAHDEDTQREAQSARPAEEPTNYSLFANPPNLAIVRQKFFLLDTAFEWTEADFDLYWPFMDNVWSRKRSSSLEDQTRTDYYWCKLRAVTKAYVPKPTSEGKRPRKKRAREEVTCDMSVRIAFKDGRYHISRGSTSDVRHSHDLDYLDGVKRNSAIMAIARREAAKAFAPVSTFWKMWDEPQKMREAGGQYMKIADVRNASSVWRAEHPDVVLKVHTGFVAAKKVTENPRPKRDSTRDVRWLPTAVTYNTGNLQVQQLPPDTLRYPIEARHFLEPYMPPFTWEQNPERTTPFVTLTYAQSLDGRISIAPNRRTALSGPESKAMTHYLRSRHEAILIGVQTAVSDDPSLNCRMEGVGGYGGQGLDYQPRPIIIDPRARLHIHHDMNLLQRVRDKRAKAPWIIVAPNAHLNPYTVQMLKQHGGEYLMVHDPLPHGQGLKWEGILGILAHEGVKSVMIEGGGVILSELLHPRYQNLVDSVIVTIAPFYLGRAGTMVAPAPAYDGRGAPAAIKLKDVKWQLMGSEDVIMCGKVIRTEAPPKPALVAGLQQFAQLAGSETNTIDPTSDEPQTNGDSAAKKTGTTETEAPAAGQTKYQGEGIHAAPTNSDGAAEKANSATGHTNDKVGPSTRTKRKYTRRSTGVIEKPITPVTNANASPSTTTGPVSMSVTLKQKAPRQSTEGSSRPVRWDEVETVASQSRNYNERNHRNDCRCPDCLGTLGRKIGEEGIV